MSAEPATTFPAAPRTIPWRVVAGHGAAWLWTGIALLVGGVVWVTADGSSMLAALRHDRGAATGPIGLLMLPGIACLGIWLRGTWALKHLLASGRRAPVRVRFIDPPIAFWRWRARVGICFRDPEQREYCSVESCDRMIPPLFHGGGRGLSVIYDATNPRRCHLIHPASFATQLQ